MLSLRTTCGRVGGAAAQQLRWRQYSELKAERKAQRATLLYKHSQTLWKRELRKRDNDHLRRQARVKGRACEDGAPADPRYKHVPRIAAQPGRGDDVIDVDAKTVRTHVARDCDRRRYP